MPLLVTFPAAGAPANSRNALAALGVALLFGGIFLLVRRLPLPDERSERRRFLSFAAGISLAYVFVHVIPALHGIREFHAGAPGARLFPEHSVYLWTMAGFLAFYGLEILGSRPSRGSDRPRRRAAVGWVHVSGFALYTWLLTFLTVWNGKGSIALALYAAAMAMHLYPIGWNLRARYRPAFDGGGAWMLALSAVAGWGCALWLGISTSLLSDLVAFVAGGVIVNSAITELHEEKEGRYGSFVAGTAVYTAVLLALSRFE